MVEHQPRLLGSRVRLPAGVFAIFSVSAKASLPISLSLSPFPFSFPSSSFPFLFLSLSLSLRPFVCAKKRIFAFIQKKFRLSFFNRRFSFVNDRTSSRPTCRTKVHFSVLPVGQNKSQPISVVGCPTGWTLCSSMVHSIAMQRNMVAGSGSI